jgi:IPT/TIG domain
VWRVVVFGMIVLAVTGVAVASASWLSSALGSGRAAAQNVSAGNQPTVQANGSSVTVSWSASTLSGGGAVAGYQVKRYDSSNVLQAIGPNCAGTIAGLTCTETSVPNGTWKYSVTPVQGSWSGAESPMTTVTVAAPTVTSTSPSSRPQGFTGNVTVVGTNFQNGAVATFSGTGITVNSTTFNSSTQLTANVTIAAGATTGARNVTVTNPDTGQGACTGCFTVNAAPTVTSTSPNFGYRSTTQNVTVIGTDFVSGATVSFSGTGVTVNSTTFNSSTQLTANVTISLTATTGARNVTATNPDTGTGTCAGCFTVVTAPTVTSTSPSSRGQGATSQNITVTGNYFVSGAGLAVTFSGTGITVNSTTFNSSTQLTANVTIATGATTGARNVTVTNPTGFGSGTCTNCFTVNARPGTFTLSPNSRGQGATNQNITITGTNFQSGATVSFSGTGITVNSVTFNSATSLTANITISASATTGFRSVTVTNPDAGTTTVIAFIVNAAPNPTSVTPNSGPQGAGPGNATLAGTGFVNGATVSFSGTGFTVNSVTFVSSTQLTVNGIIAENAPTGSRDVTVTNPDGGTRTCTGCFTVTAGPKPTSASPSSRARNTTGNITVTGTNFQSGASVSFSGTGITVTSTTFVSSTQLTANVTIASGAATGTRDVIVTNPDGGKGTCTGCFTVT